MSRQPRPGSVVDRAALVRQALRELVAERGFHGASMNAVAQRAGVAAGTAYVHYASKDELVFAAYLEAKAELGAAAVDGIEANADAESRFLAMWRNVHTHLSAAPERARFLVQMDASPYAREAHDRAMAVEGDPLMAVAAAQDFRKRLVPLPYLVVYDLGFGPAVRLAASGETLRRKELEVLARACWRAVSR